MLFRLLAFAAVIWFVYHIVRSLRDGRVTGGGFGGSGAGRVTDKCRNCRNCGEIFDDGVICRFNGKETFKNEIHIGNCVDWKRK